ncbi:MULTISPECIES: ATP-binding protein [Eubacteriales]|uniref:ATP-binding protein n=1 Tax=Eubacteriales TaxID=186802 RepID=UPI00051ABFD3|nr:MULTISPECIES: ATP-binding protein [Eubacteriales]
MMPEISLHILDVAENSVRAGASLVKIEVLADTARNTLSITIADNGCGMSGEQLAKVSDPFFTTRSTRKVGLGIPFFKQAAEGTGGSFSIRSKEGAGTVTEAVFVLDSIDRMPLGDMTATIHTLVTCHEEMDFYYRYARDGREFTLDTREMKEILGNVPLSSPEVSGFLKEYLDENWREVDGGSAL